MSQTKNVSWSYLWLFWHKKEEWYDKYEAKLSKEEFSKKHPVCLEDKMRMEFGFRIGKKIQDDPTFLPQIPRYADGINEYDFGFKANGPIMFDGIPMVGYADHFSEGLMKGREDKTGEHWDQEKADKHEQLTMYSLQSYLTLGRLPEWDLVWMPSARLGDGEFNFTGAPLQIFHTMRTIEQVEKFGKKIKKAVMQMEEIRNNPKIIQ
jgi:hypothetical protein